MSNRFTQLEKNVSIYLLFLFKSFVIFPSSRIFIYPLSAITLLHLYSLSNVFTNAVSVFEAFVTTYALISPLLSISKYPLNP